MKHNPTVSHLIRNTTDIFKEVDSDGKVTVNRYGKPKYVLMTVDKYKEISNAG